MGQKGTPELNLALEHMERYRANIGRSVKHLLNRLMGREAGRKQKKNKKGREPRTKMIKEISKKRDK